MMSNFMTVDKTSGFGRFVETAMMHSATTYTRVLKEYEISIL